MRDVVNQLYQKMINEELTIDDVGKKIIECVYVAPRKFGLPYMEEDDKSEYILYLLEHIEMIIKNYSKSLSSFSTYIINIVTNLRKSWYREYYHKMARGESVKYYYKKETPLVVCDTECEYETENLLVHDFNSNAYTKEEVLTILVLAMKSCFYLTTQHISVLSKISGISEEKLYSYKETLENSIEKKIVKNNYDIEKINNTYIKKNSCMLELMCVDENSALFMRLQKKQDFYTKAWKRSIELLKCSAPVKPSNKEVANVLNMQEHAVLKIIHEAKKIKLRALS